MFLALALAFSQLGATAQRRVAAAAPDANEAGETNRRFSSAVGVQARLYRTSSAY